MMSTKRIRDVNAFGQRLYSPGEVLRDAALAAVLKPTFVRICRELGVGDAAARRLARHLWDAPGHAPIESFEAHLRECVGNLVSPQSLRAALDRRAALVAAQVAPYVSGESLADIGCGDGLVAWHLRRRVRRAALVDVCCYADPRARLPFYRYREGEPLPLDETFDTSLLLTVLHHAGDPLELLRETRRVTRSRAVIIESVYGGQVAPHSSASMLLRLDEERQRKYATFIDWLYNRVFHNGVPVPFNFSTPARWRQAFARTGWRVRRIIDLGIDQPVVPEHHVLFVLDAA